MVSANIRGPGQRWVQRGRKNQGDSSPALKVKEWCRKFNNPLDHRLRTKLTNLYLTEEKSFTFVASQFLSDYGVDIREEAKTRV